VVVKGVLFDWRGTLVHDHQHAWWVTNALSRLDRARDSQVVDRLVDSLIAAAKDEGVLRAEESLDCSPETHYEGTMLWFRSAGIDDELARALYELDLDPASHPFYPDVHASLRSLREAGAAIAVVSDIHFDLRPEFAAAGLDGLIDEYVLSFEHGIQKPDPKVFELAGRALGLAPVDLLMVGDRSSHDGGAVAAGILTVLLPPAVSEREPRGLDAIVRLVGNGEHGLLD
jgi:HAD superfamily hydrolase (TIGR01493 family)